MSGPRTRLLAAISLIAVSAPAYSQSEPAADIVVTATRTPQPIATTGSAISVITAEEIERSSAKDVNEIFRRVPGLSLTQAGGPGRVQTVRIRGGDVRHTLVLIDGIRVNDPASTGREFDFSNLVLADVDRIEVLRGPQSALYGSDALGGVINIITKRGSGPPRANVSVETGRYGTKEIRAGVSGGDDRVDYSLGFSGFDTAGFSAFGYRIGRLRPFAPTPSGFEPDSAQRLGVTGRIGFKLTDAVRLEFGGSANYNRAQFDAAFGAFPDTPSLANSRLYNVYGRLIDDSSGVLRNTLTVFANRTDRESRDVSYSLSRGVLNTSAGRTDFIGERVGAEYQGDLNFGAFGLTTFGIRGEREQADSFSRNFTPPTPERRTIAAEQTTLSTFLQHQVTIGDRLHLSFGGRVDDVLDVDTFVTGRATAAYDIYESGTKLRASLGTGGKAPSLFQLYSPQFGTPSLESEHSVGADAGIDQSMFDGRLKLGLTIFTNRYRNLIDFDANPADCRIGQTFGCYFNVARARTSGVEISGDVVLVPEFAKLRLTYTYLDATDRMTGLKLARRPDDEGRVGLILTPFAGLTLEPSVIFVGDRFDRAGETGRLAPYARLDLYANYQINQTFSVFGRGENLTNARYQEVLNYGTTGRAFYGGVRATW